MVNQDPVTGKWSDGKGGYFDSKVEAQHRTQAGSGGGGGFEEQAGNAMLTIGMIGAVVGIVIYLIIVSFKYLVLLGIIWFIRRIIKKRLTKKNADPKEFKKLKIGTWIAIGLVCLLALVDRHNAKPENKLYPTIATTATISDYAEKQGKILTIQKDRILQTNEKVKLLGATGDGLKYKIETSDGIVDFVGWFNIIEQNIQLITSESEIWRAMNWKFSDAFPGLLTNGNYFVGNNQNTYISIPLIRFADNSLSGSKGARYAYYHNNSKTDEKVFASVSIYKNDPPLEVNGIAYNYSLKIENARKRQKKKDGTFEYTDLGEVKGFTGEYVVTSNYSFVGKDGKVLVTAIPFSYFKQ
jgi:hypothetical protein